MSTNYPPAVRLNRHRNVNSLKRLIIQSVVDIGMKVTLAHVLFAPKTNDSAHRLHIGGNVLSNKVYKHFKSTTCSASQRPVETVLRKLTLNFVS